MAEMTDVSQNLYLLQIQLLQEEVRKRDAQIAEITEQKQASEQPPEKKTRERMVVTPDTNTYSDFKSDGKRKPHAADSIRSYSDFKAIQDYFWNKGSYRDWMMWTVGVSLGLRISDLFSLRCGNVVEPDKKTIKPRIEIYEQKTGKLNKLLITESVNLCIMTYFSIIKYQFDLDDFLFTSKKTGGRMYEEHGWRILSSAGRAVGLPLNIGSHTMRKSFANIAACVDRSCIDMNAVAKIQGLLNHSDQRVTMNYLGTYQDMYDRARCAVSDFVLGKSGVNELIAGSQYSIDDVMRRLDALENLTQNQGD